MHTSIPDTEIRVEISSNRTHAGKTTVAVAVAHALKAFFPDTDVIVEDPEGCFLARQENMAQAGSHCALRAPSIRIVDNPRLLQGPPLLGHQTIVIETLSDDAVALLLQAYAKGEVNREMDWSDVDAALAAARVERPGYYDSVLNKLREKEGSTVMSAEEQAQQRFFTPSEIGSIIQKECIRFEAIDEDHGLYRLFAPDALQSVIDRAWDLQRRGCPPELLKVDADDIILPEEFSNCVLWLSVEKRPGDDAYVQHVMVLSHF